METDAATIAQQLTEAQRRCLLKLTEAPQLPGLNTFNANAAFNMIRIGLTKLGFDRCRLRDTYALTRDGLAVRAELERNGK